MRSISLGIFFTLTWGLAAAQSIAADPGLRGAERLFDAWMEEQVAYRGLPGVAVGVISDQQLVWAKGYGYADTAARTPMTAATKFRMASHSKLFTSTAIMQLRDQGKVRLDDPVEKYLPWFKVKPAAADDPPITIEELLTHSSGLSREAGSHWVDYKFPNAAELKNYIATTQAIYSPQVRWKYSNLALSLAGQIVEAVSGEKYADYVQHHIFDPLGMKDSSVDRDAPGLAVGYGRRMPDGSRGENAVYRRARDGACHRHHLHGGGHGEIRVAAIPQGFAGAVDGGAARDASRADA